MNEWKGIKEFRFPPPVLTGSGSRGIFSASFLKHPQRYGQNLLSYPEEINFILD
jgi:hypothetical protein